MGGVRDEVLLSAPRQAGEREEKEPMQGLPTPQAMGSQEEGDEMRLTYRKTQSPDGSTTIETPSVVGAAWRVIRWAVAFLFFLTALGALINTDWSTAGWCIVLALLFIPRVKR